MEPRQSTSSRPENNKSGRDIIVVGASAGGVEVLSQLVRGLPANLPAAIFVVLHISPNGPSVLPNILNRRSSLNAYHPKDGDPILHGRIYVAPPDRHLLVKRGHVHVAHGPKENRHRPAIDPLFRTAARAYGARVVGIVLSGSLDDGTAGLIAIKNQGGVAIAQDPEEALYDSMPRSAIENVEIDCILPVSEMAHVLVRLANEPVAEIEPENNGSDRELEMESGMAELDIGAMQSSDRPGKVSGYSCPECGGVLWELEESNLLRFRCRVGHAYSAASLLDNQNQVLEEALWSALRGLKERGVLARRMALRAREQGHNLTAERFEAQAQEAERHAEVIRKVLLKGADEQNGAGEQVSR
ncbi:MAG TPA: chemotaxis protein CheB [Cyanobacteria bacterium UBA11372]|nr:chemotaxis protein CheB [Cyanobacteria bacterium UBA11372]